MPSHIAENNTVILPDGRFGAIEVATCRNARDAKFVAACFNAFANVSDAARLWLLDGGAIAKAAEQWERESDKAWARALEDRAAEDAERAAEGRVAAQAAE